MTAHHRGDAAATLPNAASIEDDLKQDQQHKKDRLKLDAPKPTCEPAIDATARFSEITLRASHLRSGG